MNIDTERKASFEAGLISFSVFRFFSVYCDYFLLVSAFEKKKQWYLWSSNVSIVLKYHFKFECATSRLHDFEPCGTLVLFRSLYPLCL